MTYSYVEEMSETGVSDPTALREKGFPSEEGLFLVLTSTQCNSADSLHL